MAEYPLRRMTSRDAARAARVTDTVGWRHNTAIWKHNIAYSSLAYCIEHPYDKRLLATGSATIYEQDRAWLANIVTHAEFQGRGFGRRMTETLLAELKRRRIRELMLDASPIGAGLYERLGFRPVGSVTRWAGTVNAPSAPADAALRPALPADFETVFALDAAAFGADRRQWLGKRLQESQTAAWLTEDATGFIIQSPQRLGPWVAADDNAATTLLRQGLATLHGQLGMVWLPSQQTAFDEVLSAAGLAPEATCTRMILGDADPLGQPTRYYGAWSFAFG